MSRSKRRYQRLPLDPEQPPAALGRRVGALDLGERRIGVAMTDAGGSFVTMREVLKRTGGSADRDVVGSILDAYPGATIVIGLPLNTDGTESAQAARSRRWAARLLEGRCEPVIWKDEHLTTQAARRDGAGDADVDARAAEILLLDYLRSQRPC
ncbi:MAG: Holliday junction resolvase RuvX [Chloroflexota bacterium]|nr:Holliday junction resolvase RuvX [Chloroflexota bacterium]